MQTPANTRRSTTVPLLLFVLATGGFAALCTQVLLLRELMVAWRGNEMSFGVSLSVWLAATGAGGLLYGTVSRRFDPTPARLAAWLMALGTLGPVALAVSRLLRLALGAPAGELAGISQLVLAAIASLAPCALAAGFVFALAISVLARSSARSRSAIGSAYVLEATGALAAGALLSYVLLSRVSPTAILLASAALCGLAACLTALLAEPSPRSRLFAASIGGAVAVACGAASFAAGTSLDARSVGAQWRELGYRSHANSVYGRIVTTELGSQRSVYESGVLVASHPNRMAAEQAVHLVMLQHPEPRRVLLVGGCVGGAASEVLKHPLVEALDCVELDPLLIEEVRRQFGRAMTAGLEDPRVTVNYGDARFFVKRARGPYDVVIVAVPDPTTARLNRFYTLEFFEEVRAIMAPGGVAGLTLTSAPNYVSDELAELLACVRHTMSLAFDSVLLTPGDPCHLMGAGGGRELTRDADELSARIAERRLDVAYVRDYYIADRLSRERAAALDDVLSSVTPRTNTDLSPAGYYLSLVLWDRQLYAGRAALAAAADHVTLPNALIAAAVLTLAVLAPAVLRRAAATAAAARERTAAGALRRSVVLAVLVVGLTEISLEIASLVVFQSLYGFVYDRVALLVAAFMGGLAVGGMIGRRLTRTGPERGPELGSAESGREPQVRPAAVRTFVVLQAGITLVPLGLWRAVEAVSSLPAESLEIWAGAFPLIVVASAVLAGVQFPLAAALARARDDEPGALGGRLYGADLAGAAAGATLTAVFLLPVLGLSGAMRTLSVLNAGVLVALVTSAVLVGRRGAAARR